MATKNIINSGDPIEVEKGGTGAASHTAYSPLAGGATSTSAIQSVGSGSSGDLLISSGAASLPSWGTPDVPTYFEPLSSDPGSPSEGQLWFNTTSSLFKGYKNSTTVTFTVS